MPGGYRWKIREIKGKLTKRWGRFSKKCSRFRTEKLLKGQAVEAFDALSKLEKCKKLRNVPIE